MVAPMKIIHLALSIALCACTQFPELDGTIRPEDANAPPPSLIPVQSVLAHSAPEASIDPSISVNSRVARLRARAARLRGPVISREMRRQMLRGVNTDALQ